MLMRAIAAFALAVLATTAASAEPVRIVAAENVYGDVARQIGGADVSVVSVLSNPDQDPHLFEVSPSVARQVSAARLVIYNGADYDPWMEKLLGAARSANRTTIVVAALAGVPRGANPHIWYAPAAMDALARSLAATLGAEDPAHRAVYAQRRAAFEASLEPILAKIADLRRRFAGTPVTATEPVFGYLFDALGLKVRDPAFQLAVMNNTEPSASAVAAFETGLATHQVRLLVYNSQATDPIAARMVQLARAARVPVVAATETEPAGVGYQAWMLAELAALERALEGRAP